MAVDEGEKIGARLTDKDLADEFETWEEHFDSRAEAIRRALRNGMDIDQLEQERQTQATLVDGMFAATVILLVLLIGQSLYFWGPVTAAVLTVAASGAFAAGLSLPGDIVR